MITISTEYLGKALNFSEHRKFNVKCDIYCRNHKIDLTPYTEYLPHAGGYKKIYNLPLDLALGIVENVRMSNTNRSKVLQELYLLKGDKVVTQCHPRAEVSLMEGLALFLEELGLGLKTNHYVLGRYKLDGYIPEFNIAIEVDEPYHAQYVTKDNIRTEDITTELGRTFIRVPDDIPLPVLLAKVAHQIFIAGYISA
jgi:hypothetical protein